MNPLWFGDSYDIVKRFFVGNLKSLGFSVFVEPMFTGEWKEIEHDFYRFVGAAPIGGTGGNKTALLLDPDTGVGNKKSNQHVTIKCIANYLEQYNLVFSFDQSFSRSGNTKDKITEKLGNLKKSGCMGFYYDSHARFLFASKDIVILNEVKSSLRDIGLPPDRIIEARNT